MKQDKTIKAKEQSNVLCHITNKYRSYLACTLAAAVSVAIAGHDFKPETMLAKRFTMFEKKAKNSSGKQDRGVAFFSRKSRKCMREEMQNTQDKKT